VRVSTILIERKLGYRGQPLWGEASGSVDTCLFGFDALGSRKVAPVFIPRSSSSQLLMAYNREWDMGKEVWHEGGSWSGKGRDEDYGEGKKRKFNGGVRRPFLLPLR
jgi:hypothetical protein